jgi:16S rRNA (cytosine1402-N4)-methyltransferase
MPEEVLKVLRPEPGNIIVDGTVGEGGHSKLIIERIRTGGTLIAVDRDKNNLDAAKKRLKTDGIEIKYFCDSYSNVKNLLGGLNIDSVNGILLDLGFSTRHIEYSEKGFSFLRDEILDMRYDTDKGIPAYKWLNTAEQHEIETVLRKFGQEEDCRRIASRIVKYRTDREIKTSGQLTDIVTSAKIRFRKKINPATKTFQALRIHINNEFEEINKGLLNSIGILKEGGRLAVLTYHSLEDRIVKDFMLKYSGKCSCPPGLPVCRCGAADIRPMVKIIRPLRPTEEEIRKNPSSRSAHLRACEIVKCVDK